MTSPIIFDIDHTEALLKFAGCKRHKSTINQILQDVLASMILFDSVEIFPLSGRHGDGMNRLYDEGFVTDINFSLFKKPIGYVDQYLHMINQEYFASQNDLDEGKYNLDAHRRAITNYEPFVKESLSALKGRNIIDLMEDIVISTSFTDVQTVVDNEGYAAWFDDSRLGTFSNGDLLEAAEERGIFEWEDDELNFDDSAEMFGLYTRSRLIDDYAAFATARQKTIEFWGLFLSARERGIPVKARCHHLPCKLDTTIGPEALQLFQIHMEEVHIMPVIQTVDDILRLRSHPFIQHFREAIFERLDRIACGEMKQDEKYRRYVRVANAQLKKLGKWKVLNSPYVILASLAVGIAEPILGGSMGSIITALSGVSVLDRMHSERKYGFAAFPK